MLEQIVTPLSLEERFAGMEQVEREVHVCTRCPLAATRTHAVPGDGLYSSVILFVGEGPGFEEDKQGKPFVGRSGRFLTENLQRIGLQREDVFITNIVKCRPPDNRDPMPEEIAACSDYLSRQIALINPRIIVTLGRHSMARWLPGASITKIHGQVRNIGRGRVLLPMFHPAAALRNEVWRVEFEKDMQALPRLVERALRANQAALRGEALPAGVPHPGDEDYESPTDERAGGQSDERSAQRSAGQSEPQRTHQDTPQPGRPDDEGPLAQLSLF